MILPILKSLEYIFRIYFNVKKKKDFIPEDLELSKRRLIEKIPLREYHLTSFSPFRSHVYNIYFSEQLKAMKAHGQTN